MHSIVGLQSQQITLHILELLVFMMLMQTALPYPGSDVKKFDLLFDI